MHRPLTLALCLVYLLVVGGVSYTQVVRAVKQEAEQKIQDVASRLEIQLDKYRTLPRVLVLHPAISELLANPVEDNVRSVNRMLYTYNQSLSSDARYLMSRGGVTLAANNSLTVLFCNF